MADSDIKPAVDPRAWAGGYGPQAIHLVRTAQQINVQMSQMADQKASMLMAATFLCFTITIGQVKAGRMELPIILLAASALASAVFAILAVLPKVVHRKGPLQEQDNILFFGNFTSVGEEEWIEMVVARLATDETVFRTMLRDIHQNGMVLQYKKYRFLGLAYRIFLFGLGLTFVAFLVEMAMPHLG